MQYEIYSIAIGMIADTEPSMIAAAVAQLSAFAKVAIGIGLVIFVHELGHFAAAKLFGVKCEKFYIGFDVPMPKIGPITLPSTLGKFRYGETEYGIGILPLGGYVKMLGQNDDPRELAREAQLAEQRKMGQTPPSDDEHAETLAGAISDGPLPSEHRGEPVTPETPLDPRSYQAQPVWQRMIIISAGVVMNVITGILFAAIAYGFGVPESPSMIGEVVPGGPAWTAGMEPGGRVVAVGRKEDPQMSFREMSAEILTSGLKDAQSLVPVKVDYGGRTEEFKVRLLQHPSLKDVRMVGIGPLPGTRLSRTRPALPGTVADTVLGDDDAGSSIAAFDGQAIDPGAVDATTAFADHLYSRPREPVNLTLRRYKQYGNDRDVTLPPQTATSYGIEYSLGPIHSIAAGSPPRPPVWSPAIKLSRSMGNRSPNHRLPIRFDSPRRWSAAGLRCNSQSREPVGPMVPATLPMPATLTTAMGIKRSRSS